ncbi:uncharacterized protein LOC126576624 [Anopheles aquasalis]|uniref:uncharacterized protein LOC126576624 n=1 Tax=Anopheles aquasalis TaxID=42839 RepID=UPI00215AC34E|nr:uncharacterized protein LOC126576624 [Anopheles aquasalis]
MFPPYPTGCRTFTGTEPTVFQGGTNLTPTKGMVCSHWKTVKFKAQPPADARQNAGSLSTMLTRESQSAPVLVLERQLRLRVGQLKLVDRASSIGPDPNGRRPAVAACPERLLQPPVSF